MTTKKLISREEVLGGMPGRSIKKANTLLTLIENLTARLMAQSQPPVGLILAETTLKERTQSFLEALAMGREPPLRPTIQAIERYAPRWLTLAPDDPRVRAAVAKLLADKYRFTYQAVPQLRLALGLDSPAVQEAYQRLYHQPLAGLYAPRFTWREQVGWLGAAVSRKLEALPPFWLTFALTLPGAAGLLALPIALAQVGLATGLLLLIVFGLLNLLTAAALAEATARSRITRFGLGFLGQLCQEYLGQAGSVLMTVTLALNNFFVLIIFYIGVAATLKDATRLPTEIWVAILFGVCLYVLSRKSLNATVAATLVIVFINIMILLLIPILALPHFQAANLRGEGLPFVGSNTFDPTVWQPILGIMLSVYFSHILIAAYSPVVLRRDVGARSWIRGSAAAILIYMVISCIWLIVVEGVIPAETLASTVGTVLSPLADKIGPVIHLLGAILVVLSVGLAAIQIALGLFYLAQERLPIQAARSLSSRLGERGRFWLAASPVVGAFLLAEWIAVTGFGTFTNLLGVLSAMTLPLLAGIFPVLLLAATRRQGDFVPGVVYRLLGQPVLLGSIYLFFLGVIFIHGALIWESPVTRLIAFLVGLAVFGSTIVMLKDRALRPRLVVELRADQRDGEPSRITLICNGQAVSGDVWLGYAAGEEQVQANAGSIRNVAGLRYARLHLPPTPARQLKVWTHTITPDGASQDLPARLTIEEEDDTQQMFDLHLSDGQVVLPLNGAARRLEIRIFKEIKND
ncbi:MAG: hypothetical protein AB1801_03970 [Chloroflexota bacterium]